MFNWERDNDCNCVVGHYGTVGGCGGLAGFLGAGASSVDPASIPLKWSPTENVAWDASLPGHGQSSPVVWGDKVFVTSVEGPNKETCHTLGLSLTDGKILWNHKTHLNCPRSQQRLH